MEGLEFGDLSLVSIVENALNELNEFGYISGGNNGPYYDTDTPVRNTAHYTAVFLYMYSKTKDIKYHDAVKKCADYLISSDSRPMGANFFCRYNTTKDFANGTIGAAWAIEGLVCAYRLIKDEQYIKVAKEVFLLFPFDKKRCLWKIINVDGSQNNIDQTFNHQLWLAVAGLQILSVSYEAEIQKLCDRFFENIKSIFNIYSNGLIKHSLYTKASMQDVLLNGIRKALIMAKTLKTGKSMKYKENGYHLFNIYAFAIIKDLGYNYKISKSKKFKKALEYCFNNDLYNWLEKKSIQCDMNTLPKVKNKKINIYGYAYNAPGFELPYIYKVFSGQFNDQKALVKKVIEKQIELTYSIEKKSFCNKNEDEKTLNARIYEYVRGL